MSNYIFVFYLLHLLFCLIYYIFLARREKLAMTLLPLVIFIPYVGFLGISAYFLAVRFADRTEDLALDELIMPTDHIDHVGIESREKVNKTVPVEEALKINDLEVQREIVLEVAKRDPEQYLEALKQALISEDPEISHYAATSITKLKRVLDKRLAEAKDKYLEDSEDKDNVNEYVASLDSAIKGDLSVESITNGYITDIIKVLEERLSASDKGSRNYFQMLIIYLIKQKEFKRALKWVERYKKDYFEEDDPLRLMLKVGFESNDEILFEKAADMIIDADFPIRKSTMDLVNYWR